MESTKKLTEAQMTTIMAFLQKLEGLKIKASLSRVEEGPVITGFYFKLEHSESISKILNKAEDFALASGVERVTITRDKGEIVIFAPNEKRNLIEYKKYLNWFMSSDEVENMSVPIALGVNHLGQEKALDLGEMPHILLAGATGSGKSVFESAIICSLCVARSFEDLQLYLVDTKQLDLPLFFSLPHVRETVTELSEFHRVMSDLLSLCYIRMETMKGCSCRNILEYHRLEGSKKNMPFIVVVIDEFADLLEQDKAWRRSVKSDKPTVDTWLKRLVQISRAAGIHVIAGTQRTSVKIVSGDIKANFLCRISLQLPTEFDSRTILDAPGAETLLGKGDMLIKMPSSDTLQRFHGPYVDLNDIAWIISEHEYVRDMYLSLKRNKQT